jgi:hypothetical protein
MLVALRTTGKSSDPCGSERRISVGDKRSCFFFHLKQIAG